MKKKGQVWIETVIYTLIGLSLIGLVLGVVTPQINKYRDKSIIDQTISSLGILDSKIEEILSAPGNVRIVEFRMKRGELYIDPQNDSISFIMADSKYLFSEEGQNVSLGRIRTITYEKGNDYEVNLILEYPFDIVTGSNTTTKLSQAPTPYRISLENRGFEDGRELIYININS